MNNMMAVGASGGRPCGDGGVGDGATKWANGVRPNDDMMAVGASGGRPMTGESATNRANAVRPYDDVTAVGASGGRPCEVDGDA